MQRSTMQHTSRIEHNYKMMSKECKNTCMVSVEALHSGLSKVIDVSSNNRTHMHVSINRLVFLLRV